MSQPAILSVKELSGSIQNSKLLDQISLSLSAGETVGIIGPNGAGKSTLLKFLAGLLTPDSGQRELLGESFQRWSSQDFARQVAYQEQTQQFAWPLPVREVVGLGRLPWRGQTNLSAESHAAIIAAALTTCGISALAERRIDSLSAGEQALAGLARVLAGQPALILADEPAAALDPYYQLLLMEILRNHARSSTHSANLIVLHDLNLAARFCQRLLLLYRGRIVAAGPPRDVLTEETLARYYRVETAIMDSPQGLQIAVLKRLAE